MRPGFINLIIRFGQLWRRVVAFFTSKEQILEFMFYLLLVYFSSMAILVTLVINFPYYIIQNVLYYYFFSWRDIYYYLVYFSLHDFLEWFYVSPIEVSYLVIVWALWASFWFSGVLFNIFFIIYNVCLGGTVKEFLVYMFVRFRRFFF